MTAAGGTFAGRRMVSQLQAMHEPLRRDVASLHQVLAELSSAVVDVNQVDTLIRGMTIADLTWQLTTGCQWYCNSLDIHHKVEDASMFPVMQREFPDLGDAIDTLRRQHQQMLQLLQQVVRTSGEMTPEAPATIVTVRDLVGQLATMLAGHLDLEEETLFPYFLQMDRDWHYG